MILEDITAAPLEPLSSWEDYYTWRGFDFSSPIAVLMHTVLTVYHIIQVSSYALSRVRPCSVFGHEKHYHKFSSAQFRFISQIIASFQDWQEL